MLFIAGAVMILLAVAVEDRETVAAALVGFGAALMPLAVLLPRLVGPLRVSAQGFEAQLVAVVKAEAQAKGFSTLATERALEFARSESESALREWVQGVLSDAEEQAKTGEVIEINQEKFEAGLHDPRVQEFFQQAKEYWARLDLPEGRK